MWPDFPPVWWCTGWKHIRHCSTTCQTRPGKDPTFFPASIGECDPSTRLTQVLPRRRHQQKNLGPFSGKDAPTPLSLPSPRHLLTQLKSKNVPSGTSKVGNDNKSFVCFIAGGVGFNYKTHTRETTASRTHMCDVYCWLVAVPFPFEKEKKESKFGEIKLPLGGLFMIMLLGEVWSNGKTNSITFGIHTGERDRERGCAQFIPLGHSN